MNGSGGNTNGIATSEDGLAISYEAKHTFTIWFSSNTPWCLPKEAENVCPHGNLHSDVYSRLIHTHQNLEATTMSFSR